MSEARHARRHWGFALFGLTTLVASVTLGYQEWNAGLDFATSDAGRIALLVGADLPLPLAEGARQTLVSECVRLQATPRGRLLPTKQRARLLATCNGLAIATVQSAPTLSLVWLGAAAIAAERGEIDDFNMRLRRAYDTAPSEQWLAERRVSLTEANFEIAATPVRLAELADLKMLVLSPRGIHSLARRYVSEPDFRERVTGVVEQLPEVDQRRFLQQVRQAASSV